MDGQMTHSIYWPDGRAGEENLCLYFFSGKLSTLLLYQAWKRIFWGKMRIYMNVEKVSTKKMPLLQKNMNIVGAVSYPRHNQGRRDETHDGKGITHDWKASVKSTYHTFVVTQVEKRIEDIRAGPSQSKEKERYPRWLESQERRVQSQNQRKRKTRDTLYYHRRPGGRTDRKTKKAEQLQDEDITVWISSWPQGQPYRCFLSAKSYLFDDEKSNALWLWYTLFNGIFTCRGLTKKCRESDEWKHWLWRTCEEKKVNRKKFSYRHCDEDYLRDSSFTVRF